MKLLGLFAHFYLQFLSFALVKSALIVTMVLMEKNLEVPSSSDKVPTL